METRLFPELCGGYCMPLNARNPCTEKVPDHGISLSANRHPILANRCPIFADRQTLSSEAGTQETVKASLWTQLYAESPQNFRRKSSKNTGVARLDALRRVIHQQPDLNCIQVLEEFDFPCTVHAQRVPFKGNQLRAEMG
jgi:hypothetical protein